MTPPTLATVASSRTRSATTLVFAVTLLLAGCGGNLDNYLPDERLEYKKAREARENLELPPDLAGGSFDDAMDVPPIAGSATYSGYAGEREARARIAGSGEVLPAVGGASLKRAGNKRWLEVDASPQAVWPRVVAFWRDQGILLEESNPAVGVMTTDWLENRADIRDDMVTRTLRKVVDGLYATSTRDQYRVRLDQGPRPSTTEVYLTHRSMEERIVRNTVGEGATTVWEPADNDPGKEALMLRRLMLFLGVTDRAAERMLAAAADDAAASGPRARLVQDQGGSELVLAEEYRQAWRRTGLALDRTGFAVDDRDRSRGIFFVRYDDPGRKREQRGMLSRMAFWRGKGGNRGVERYQVRLEGVGDRTNVRIYSEEGQREGSATATRILGLLEDELR